ncbi:MAG: peptidase E [Thermoflexales bacterium]
MRQIIAMGGGGFSMEPDNPLLDQFVLGQTGLARPKVCFLPHASDDTLRYIHNFFQAFTRLECRPSSLSLFSPHTRDIRGFLLEQDVIYVGGGNTKSMLALWRAWSLDAMLREAWEKGVVLAGISAGANCWFEACSTDSYGVGSLRPLSCLGLLSGGFCPHYDGEAQRRPTLRAMVGGRELPDSWACDDGAALHFIDDAMREAVSSRATARAYHVALGANGDVSETPLATRYLGE